MNSIFGFNNQNGVQPVNNYQQPSPFANFVSNFMRKFPNCSPQQLGMQLLNSGKLSQADFQAFSEVANRLTGRR